MSFVKSLLFGSEGSYHFLGIPVNFIQDTDSSYSLEGAGMISSLASKCLANRAFRLASLGYTHILVHELGHSFVYKYLSKGTPSIRIYLNNFTGFTNYFGHEAGSFERDRNNAWNWTMIDLAGPLTNTIFSISQIILALKCKNYLSLPVAALMGIGGATWISGELLYAFVSASQKDQWDFGMIARRGKIHLAAASIALVSPIALGILTALKF